MIRNTRSLRFLSFPAHPSVHVLVAILTMKRDSSETHLPQPQSLPCTQLFGEPNRGISMLYANILLSAAHVTAVKVSLNHSNCQCVIAILKYSSNN